MPSQPHWTDMELTDQAELRQSVIDVALHLLDGSGPRAVTTAAVANALGISVGEVAQAAASNNALLDLACDGIYEQIDLRPVDLPWPERLRRYARSFRTALLGHPHAATLMAIRPIVTARSLQVAERALAELTKVGFSTAEANQVLVVIVSFVHGHVLSEIGHHPEFGGHDPSDLLDLRRALPTDRLPLIAAALVVDSDRDAEFELGLKLLIDGLERRLLHAAPAQ